MYIRIIIHVVAHSDRDCVYYWYGGLCLKIYRDTILPGGKGSVGRDTDGINDSGGFPRRGTAVEGFSGVGVHGCVSENDCTAVGLHMHAHGDLSGAPPGPAPRGRGSGRPHIQKSPRPQGPGARGDQGGAPLRGQGLSAPHPRRTGPGRASPDPERYAGSPCSSGKSQGPVGRRPFPHAG